RAYRATRVNDVNWDQLAQGKDGLDIALGVDVGKYSLWAVCRWADGRFERPWRVQNPGEIPTLLTLLKRVSAGRKLVVAMESSGTSGDAPGPPRHFFLSFPDPTGLQVLKKCRVSGRRHFCHPTSFQGRGCENGRSTEDPASGS